MNVNLSVDELNAETCMGTIPAYAVALVIDIVLGVGVDISDKIKPPLTEIEYGFFSLI